MYDWDVGDVALLTESYQFCVAGNQPPVIEGPSSVLGNHCLPIFVEFSATDPEGDEFWWELLSGPGILDDYGVWTYDPNPADVYTSQAVELQACDVHGACDTAWMDVIVTNDPPIWVSGCGETVYGSAGEIITHQLTWDEVDCLPVLTMINDIVPMPAGAVDVDPGGMVTFYPAPGDVGTFTFSILVHDEVEDGDICEFMIAVEGQLPFVSVTQLHNFGDPTRPTAWGRFTVDIESFLESYPPGIWFVNAYTGTGWVVGNMTVFTDKDGSQASKHFDIGVDPGDIVEALPMFVTVTAEPLLELEPGTMDVYPVEIANIQGGGIPGADDYYVPEDDPPAPREFNDDSTIQYWVLPLGENENVQAEENQCVATAVANSLQFLSNNYGSVFRPRLPNTPGQNGDSCLVGKLGECMGYHPDTGVFLGRMLNGKLNCLDQWGLGNALVHRTQGTGFLPGESTLPDSLYTSGKIHDDSHNGRVTWEWIYQQIKRGEDVELSMTYPDTLKAHDGSDSIVTRAHMVRVYGAGNVNGTLRLRILDDGMQGDNTAGAQNYEVDVEYTDPDSTLLLDPSWEKKKKCQVTFAMSESPKEHYAPPDNTYPWHNDDDADNTGAEDSGDANGLTGSQWRPLGEPNQGEGRWGRTIPLPGDGELPVPFPPPPMDRPVRIDPRDTIPIIPTWRVPERITLTITIIPPPPEDSVFLDHLGVNPFAKPLSQVVPSFWHEIRPNAGNEWEVQGWLDNGDGILSSGDNISGVMGTTKGKRTLFDFEVSDVAMDVWFYEMDTMPTFYNCDWYKDQYTDLANFSVPDFDQKQSGWQDFDLDWNHCGPSAAANALWWIDSKMEPSPIDPHPFGVTPPNDGYPLVTAYGGWDDHDTLNAPPLINDLSAYMGTGTVIKGTSLSQFISGVRAFVNDAGLAQDYKDTLYEFPYFSHIRDELLLDHDVMLRLMIYEKLDSGDWVPIGAHYVTVAGFCSQRAQICISDPWIDYLEGEPPAGSTHGPTVHNDADSISGPHGQIQHDPYDVWTDYLHNVSPAPVSIIDYPIGYEELQNFESQNTTVWYPYQGGRVLMVINEAYVIQDEPLTGGWDFEFRGYDTCQGGDLKVWGTVNCGTIGSPVYDGYAAVNTPVKGSIPAWANDLLIVFKWHYWCNNVDSVKLVAPIYDGHWKLQRLLPWIEAQAGKGEIVLPTLGDPTGTVQYVHTLVNLEGWANPTEMFEEYDFVDGACGELPGYLVGTTPFVFDEDAGPGENPFSTTPFTGTLYRDGQVTGTAGGSCCIPPIRGDVNYDGAELIDIADLVYLVDYMFNAGPPPQCFEEADVDASGFEPLDIADLVYLVDFMFNYGPSPPPCP